LTEVASPETTPNHSHTSFIQSTTTTTINCNHHDPATTTTTTTTMTGRVTMTRVMGTMTGQQGNKEGDDNGQGTAN
jgi:hypothetical protein